MRNGSLASRLVVRLLASAFVGLLTAGPTLNAGEAPAAKDRAPAASTPQHLNASNLAERIDRLLASRWIAQDIVPAPMAGDAEFHRRLYLDLVGKIPSAGETQAFLDDRSSNKRKNLVAQLLSRAAYATHFANIWRDLMLPGADNNFQTRALVPQFEAWLRLRFVENTPYDVLVAELFTATSSGNAVQLNPAGGGEPSPIAFFVVNEQKPENLAASTSRLFLGVQMQCAQCHNHPFADWKQETFWQFASFFGSSGGAQGPLGPVADSYDRKGLAIPGKDKVVEPRFLDGTKPIWQEGVGKRATLAGWVTAPDNPYFARAAVNRLWSHFFGHGFVEPVDNLDDANPPSHPEIFEELTRQFVEHNFDLKYLVRAITATRAYQLSSESTHASQDEPGTFAKMPLRSMSGEQLFDSLVQATGLEVQDPDANNFFAAANSARAKFLNRFSDSGRNPTEHQATILQALTLMNGNLIADATSLSRGEILPAILEAPFLDTPQKIEALFLTALSRRPLRDEAAQMLEYVNAAGTEEARKQAFADVFWALLNSTEFVLVH